MRLDDAIRCLQHDRPTERTAGLDLYRQIFAKETSLRSLAGNDATWTQVFQALFKCVLAELDTCTRKGDYRNATSVQLNRLTAASSTVRWLTERAFPHFERKTAKALVVHLGQTIVRNGELVAPIALNYLKALSVVLAYAPHRNGLDQDQWLRLVALCFNVVMSRNLTEQLPDLEAAAWKEDENITGEPTQHSLGLEDIEVMTSLGELISSSVAPLNTRDKVGTRILAQYAVFFSRFTHESTAHFPSIVGLNKLLREIELNDRDAVDRFITKTWKVLVGFWESKNKAFKEQLIITFRILLPHLTAAVPTSSPAAAGRDVTTKAQLLSSLCRQLNSDAENRFSVGPLPSSSITFAARGDEKMPRLRPLWYRSFAAGTDFTAANALSWTALELTSDVIAHLCHLTQPSASIQSPGDNGADIETSTSGSSRKKLMSNRKRSAEEQIISASKSVMTSSHSGKRRKVDIDYSSEALAMLINALFLPPGETFAKAQGKRLWTLQMMLFLVVRNWSLLSSDEQHQIFESIQILLNDGDPDIQTWALICLGAVADVCPSDWMRDAWFLPWTLCCRRVNVPSQSRAAAMAATSILQNGRLPKEKSLSELNTLFSDLDLSSPSFPYDSVARFFTAALGVCSSDVSLARRNLEEKVASWLITTWTPVQGISKGIRVRSKVPEQDSMSTLGLLCQMCHLNELPVGILLPASNLPGSPSVEQVIYELETAAVRNFILDAVIDRGSPHQLISPETTVSHFVDHIGESTRSVSKDAYLHQSAKNFKQQRAPSGLQLRCCNFLSNALSVLWEEWLPPVSSSTTEDAPFTDTATMLQSRKTIEVIVVALLFDAALASSYIVPSSSLASNARRLLVQVGRTLSEPHRWTLAERASLLIALEPLVRMRDPVIDMGVADLLNGIVPPGRSSGVRRQVLTSVPQGHRRDATALKAKDLRMYLRHVWDKSSEMRDEFLGQIQSCLKLLYGEDQNEDQLSDLPEDDGWGRIKQAKVDSENLLKPAEDHGADRFALATAISLCMSALVDIPMVVTGESSMLSTTAHGSLDAILLEGPLIAVDMVSDDFVKALAEGGLHVTYRVVIAFMTRLGVEYLPDYSFRQSEHAQLVVLRYLEATVNLWRDTEKADTDLAARSDEFCQHFAKALKKGKPVPWRVRVQATHFFEILFRSAIDRDGWADDGSPLCAPALASLICGIASDADMRVRFAAAPIIAKLFERCPTGAEEVLHLQATDQMSSEPDNFEGMLARSLTSANIMIASSPLRATSLFFLIEPCLLNKITNAHGQELLRVVAKSLGFSSAPEMFTVFAAQLTFGMLESNYDPTRLPANVLGYQSIRQCLEHTFIPIGSMMAAMAIEDKAVANQFASLARSIRKTEAEGIAECLPFVLAIEFVFAVKDILASAKPDCSQHLSEVVANVRRRLLSGDKSFITAQAIDNTMAEKLDQVVLALLLQFWELDTSIESSFVQQLSRVDAMTAADYCSLLGGVGGPNLDPFPHEPIRPHASGMEIFCSIRGATRSIKTSLSKACIYHVIQQLLSFIWSERLVNDQLRHLSALKLYLAMHSRAIVQDTVLLRLLLNGVSVLMRQSDLLQSASGIVDWCLERIGERSQSVPHLSSCLTRITEQAEAYSLSTDRLLSELGGRIYTWIEGHFARLIEQPATETAVFDSLVAFPRGLPQNLKIPQVNSSIGASGLSSRTLSLATISEVLERNSTMTLNKHLLERVREALASSTDKAEIDDFSRSTIWRLFSRLRRLPSGRACSPLGDVIADILFGLEGHIKTPTTSQMQNPAHDGCLQSLQELLKGTDTVFGPLKAFVVLQILEIHRDEDLGLAQSTLSCLRAVMTLDPAFSLVASHWPPSMRDELELLSAFPTRPVGYAHDRASEDDFLSKSSPALDFDHWIRQLAAYLCSRLAKAEPESFYSQVRPLMLSITQLANRCLPALLHSLLALDYDEAPRPSSFKSEISQYFTKVLDNSESDPSAWAVIISNVLYTRTQRTPDILDHPLASDNWYDIDFLLMARRAIEAKLFTTALLFVELARENDVDRFLNSQHITSHLLYEIYSNIEDPDSFYGVVNPDLRLALVKRLHHEGEWQRAFELYAADYESVALAGDVGPVDAAGSAARGGVSFALHEMGFNRLASGLVGANVATDIHALDYEMGWRTDDWNLPVDSHVVPGHSMGVFAALRALHRERDPCVIDEIIDRGLGSETLGLSGVGVESIIEVRRIACDMLSLREIKQWRRITLDSPDLQTALSKIRDWPCLSEGFTFPDCERILTVRQSVLRAERRLAQADQIGDMMEESTQTILQLEGALLLRLSKAARKRDKFQAAMNAVTMADKLNRSLPEPAQLPELSPEFASVLWSQGEHAIAMQALYDCLSTLPAKPRDPSHRARRAILMAQLGQWRAVARSQQPRIINDEFFRPAVALIEKQKKECTAVYHQYAVFANEQYCVLRNSNETQQLEAFVSHRREEIRQHEIQMSKYPPNSHEHNQFRHHRSQAQKICKQDEAALDQHHKSRETFLQQAFKMYAAALTYSDDFDDAAVKLTSLWFENAEDASFNAAIAETLAVVPSHKFIKMTHQLSSRLSKVTEASGLKSSTYNFHSDLAKLMTRMCSFHPFHCLYAIFALRKADFDESVGSPTKSSKRSSTPQASQRSRGAAAQDLWNKVKATSPHKTRIIQFEKVCFAYVEWAELDLKTSMPSLFTRNGGIASGKHNIPTTMRLAIQSLHNTQTPVATVDIAADPSSEYRNIPTIARYSSQFETAGGLHLPKITECIGSDGARYKQLFKSQDDLRQDAVMQQVFTLLNGLLASDQRASERELKIRTYIVLPLGPQCGLLEFVGNTSPIGNIFVAAHEKYRRDDHLGPSQARSELASVGGKSPQQKLEKFRQVCKQMPPCFRFYFFEQYKVPTTWFSARLNYTRSVAATSIIGHVLGLGDRHVSNILIDQVTGEVIHIDFGVAFEQGKLLPIPESVPFRLTRDIVDGMGLSGVEGVYRRCCEETLRVLRDGSDVIKTVLEVFKYDPLFAWTSNPVKVIRAQRGSDATGDQSMPTTVASGSGSGATATTVDEHNLAGAKDTASLSAERAIGSVMGKLSSSLSTQYTVNQVIQMAQDEVNLSAIFHGWQPAL